MEMRDGILSLGGVRGLTVFEDSVGFTDSSGNKLAIPTATLIHLYEGMRRQITRDGRDWNTYQDIVLDREFAANQAKSR